MPHISHPLVADADINFLLNPGPVVSPIVGNTEQGGAAYDPGTGEAVYATYHNNAMRCFRTTEGYRQLVLEDDSVTEVGIIRDATLYKQRSVGLTVIDGSLYALVVGSDPVANIAATWVYRDESGTSGEGPWTLISTIPGALPSGTTGGEYEMIQGSLNYGGEILAMPSGRWFCAPTRVTLVNFGGLQRLKGESGIWYSDNQGVSWDVAFYFIQGGLGWSVADFDGITGYVAVQVYGGSRSFGKLSNTYYAGFGSNTTQELHAHTTDGAVWTRYQIGTGGNSIRYHAFSVGNRIFAVQNGILSWTDGLPETNPTYHDPINLTAAGFSDHADTVPAACVIGPSTSPLVAMTKLGKVMGIGRVAADGWVIGRVGSTW